MVSDANEFSSTAFPSCSGPTLRRQGDPGNGGIIILSLRAARLFARYVLLSASYRWRCFISPLSNSPAGLDAVRAGPGRHHLNPHCLSARCLPRPVPIPPTTAAPAPPTPLCGGEFGEDGGDGDWARIEIDLALTLPWLCDNGAVDSYRARLGVATVVCWGCERQGPDGNPAGNSAGDWAGGSAGDPAGDAERSQCHKPQAPLPASRPPRRPQPSLLTCRRCGGRPAR